MIIDCDSCVMQHTQACDDCVVTAVVEPQRGPLIFDGDEVVAITLLQDAGLLPATRFEPDDEASEVLGWGRSGAAQCDPRDDRPAPASTSMGDRERAAAGGLHG